MSASVIYNINWITCVYVLFYCRKKTKQNGFHVSCLCTLLIVWTLTYAIGIVKTRTYRLVPSIHWCKYLVLYVYIYCIYYILCAICFCSIYHHKIVHCWRDFFLISYLFLGGVHNFGILIVNILSYSINNMYSSQGANSERLWL